MDKPIRIYREFGYYVVVGHPRFSSFRYYYFDSLLAEIYYSGISLLDIDFSDIDITIRDYECNKD